MSQISLSPSHHPSFDLYSQHNLDRFPTGSSTRASSQNVYSPSDHRDNTALPNPGELNRSSQYGSPASTASPHETKEAISARATSDVSPCFSDKVDILVTAVPETITDYTEHLFKIATLLAEGSLTQENQEALKAKFESLADLLPQFVETENPARSRLYLVVERCFDVFINISTNLENIELATMTIRLLTSVVMNLNYWELYNLLQWKPAIYQFLTLINFDLNECYLQFVKNYQKYAYKQYAIPELALLKAAEVKERMRRNTDSSLSPTPEEEGDKNPVYFITKELRDDHDKFVLEQMEEKEKPIPRERRKIRVDAKLAAHRIIKRTESELAATNRSSNYDPDVIHECQLPLSSDDPTRLCLRRFSRKYELIRHQETVHSKKKKLFKCFVCVKQDPAIGPRIFTRHDTLAKHIRVNHRISGKEAKAEVAYSKKHAEIVEEGDITVHVGRRKTKVDFELRAHMERKESSREGTDGSVIFDDEDSPAGSVDYGDGMAED